MRPEGNAAPSSSASTASTFKFLLTTDNHLGYQERDPRRGDDSFTTFEECLRAARIEHDVDAILLGGDLFHDNKPSLGCLARTTALLRTYIIGEKTVGFTLLSDAKKNFPTHPLPLANFQDPNMNIATPIFMIHGNHDDPVGGTSSIDILASNGLVNYFGQVPSLDDIVLEPVLLKKGNTYVALYGLGNVRDERLHRCFRMKKIHFVQPKPISGKRWFKILLLHQNRGVRGGLSAKGGIFEDMLSGFNLDLVIWGNEHEQQMIPTSSKGFDIIQPGSTILTSLSGQECNPKQYGVLEVREGSYRLTPFPLRSVRPVVRRTVELWRENPSGRTLGAVEDFLRHVVDEMIEEAEEQISRIPDDVLKFHPNIKFPLMRLSVDFIDPTSTNFPQPNINRFGQQYMDVVVNPGELLRPIKPKAVVRRVQSAPAGDGTTTTVVVPAPLVNTLDIRAKVAEVFNANAKNACALLSEPEVSAAVYAFAEKGERDAIDERINELLNKCQKSIWKSMKEGGSEDVLNPENIYSRVTRHKEDINRRYAEITHANEGLHQHQIVGEGKEETGERHACELNKKSDNIQNTSSAHSSFKIIDMFDGGGVPLGTSSSNSLSLSSISFAPNAAPMKRDVFNNNNTNNNEEEDGEELPDAGLVRGSLDTLIASAVQRDRNAATTAAKRNTATKRQRDEFIIADDDDSLDVGTEAPRPAAKRGGRQNTSTNSAPTPAAKPTRGRRGKQATATLFPTPSLPLHTYTPSQRTPRNGGLDAV